VDGLVFRRQRCLLPPARPARRSDPLPLTLEVGIFCFNRNAPRAAGRQQQCRNGGQHADQALVHMKVLLVLRAALTIFVEGRCGHVSDGQLEFHDTPVATIHPACVLLWTGKRTGGCLGREGVIGALGAKIGIDKIGIDLLAKSGFTAEKVAAAAKDQPGRLKGNPHESASDQIRKRKEIQGPG